MLGGAAKDSGTNKDNCGESTAALYHDVLPSLNAFLANARTK